MLVPVTVVVSAVFVQCVSRVIIPVEEEFVVADRVIREGRTDRPGRQTRIELSRVRAVVHMTRDRELFADLNKTILEPLGVAILQSSKDQSALVDFFREHYPHIPIRTW